MNISSTEAFLLLETWRDARIPLRVNLSGKELQTTIGTIAGTVVNLITLSGNVQVDVKGADFNGDARPKGSNCLLYTSDAADE